MKPDKHIAETIRADIETGIYDNWPKLKSQLNRIADKIIKVNYCVNADGLTSGDLFTLRINGYITPEELSELRQY